MAVDDIENLAQRIAKLSLHNTCTTRRPYPTVEENTTAVSGPVRPTRHGDRKETEMPPKRNLDCSQGASCPVLTFR